jgi:hypothetical protein
MNEEIRYVDGPRIIFYFSNPFELICWNGSHTFSYGYFPAGGQWNDVDIRTWFPDDGDNLTFEQAHWFAKKMYEEVCESFFDDGKEVIVR